MTFSSGIQATAIPEFEPEPNLDDSMLVRVVAGIRPFRQGGVRIEHERIHGKSVIHNYGHGGAGVTMSWGSAREVQRLADQQTIGTEGVVVLGAGVIGLTAAILLRESGRAVRVIASEFTPDTTSDVAGAQWSPSLVEWNAVEPKEKFDRILEESLNRFLALKDREYGISVRPNYVEADHDSSFYKIPEGLLPKMQELNRLPFRSNPVMGRVFTTLLIETPIFMPRLMEDCKSMGIGFEQHKIGSIDELVALPERLIVNCTGMGARTLFSDEAMLPIRGQLAVLKPQELPWMLSHKNGYIFPRADGVILGGTVERGVEEKKNTEEAIQTILKNHRTFFRHGQP